MQEPFRWLVDLAVIQAFESKTLELHDFYFIGDDYRYRFEADTKQRFIDIIRERFNTGVAYRGRALKWDTVIQQKTNELGRFLIGQQLSLDFADPVPKLGRRDSRELRAKILELTASQAEQLGIGKSTLHYLRRSARTEKLFRPHSRTYQRLSSN